MSSLLCTDSRSMSSTENKPDEQPLIDSQALGFDVGQDHHKIKLLVREQDEGDCLEHCRLVLLIQTKVKLN